MRQIGVCACIAAWVALLAGCGTHGPVTNGGIAAPAAVAGKYGTLSGDKKFQTGAITLMQPGLKPRGSGIRTNNPVATGANAALYQNYVRQHSSERGQPGLGH